MNREQARERLQDLCRLEDDWFTLKPTGEPDRFTVEAGLGAGADVYLSDRWVEVCAIRPLDRLMQAAGESVRGRGALLCATMLPRDPRRVAFRGRVYLDGFTEHAFFVMAGEVLHLAGPATDQDREGRPAGSSADVPAAGSTGEDLAEEEPFQQGALASVEAAAEAEADQQIAATAVPASSEPPAPEPREPEPMEATIAAAEPEPLPSRGLADTYPGLRAQPAPGVPEALPSEWEIAPTIQIPRRVAIPDPDAPAAAGPRPCPTCGEAVQPGERFCIGCGSQIPPGFFEQAAPPSGWSRPAAAAGTADAPASSDATVECQNCRYVNPAGNRFCQGCGSRLAG
jgi:hypothetical protein